MSINSTSRPAVWLARFDRNPLLRHAWWRKELTAAGKGVAELYVLTFDTLAGVLLIRKASAPGDWGLAERNDWFVRVWPSVDSVTWPPQRPVTVRATPPIAGAAIRVVARVVQPIRDLSIRTE